jgi:hypothetical protein
MKVASRNKSRELIVMILRVILMIFDSFRAFQPACDDGYPVRNQPIFIRIGISYWIVRICIFNKNHCFRPFRDVSMSDAKWTSFAAMHS